METLTLVLSVCSVLFTGITSFFSIFAYAKVVGMEKSTHKIEWVPLKNDEGEYENPTGTELAKKIAEPAPLTDSEGYY